MWGGKRENTGRPKSPVERKRVSFYLSEDEIVKVREYANKLKRKNDRVCKMCVKADGK